MRRDNVLDELQRQVGLWETRNFPDASHLQRALVICEEAGELAHVIVKQSQGIRPESSSEDDLTDAMADIVIAVLALSEATGYSLMSLLITTTEKVLARDWRRPPDVAP